MTYYLKAPETRIDYTIDWDAGYIGNRVLSTSQWRILPREENGLDVFANHIQEKQSAATLCGGIPGKIYPVTNNVTLSDSRQDSRTFLIRVEER